VATQSSVEVNNVRDVIIAHVISADAQIYIYICRRGKRKIILGPAGCMLRAWSAGKSRDIKQPLHLHHLRNLHHTTAHDIMVLSRNNPYHVDMSSEWQKKTQAMNG